MTHFFLTPVFNTSAKACIINNIYLSLPESLGAHLHNKEFVTRLLHLGGRAGHLLIGMLVARSLAALVCTPNIFVEDINPKSKFTEVQLLESECV